MVKQKLPLKKHTKVTLLYPWSGQNGIRTLALTNWDVLSSVASSPLTDPYSTIPAASVPLCSTRDPSPGKMFQ